MRNKPYSSIGSNVNHGDSSLDQADLMKLLCSHNVWFADQLPWMPDLLTLKQATEDGCSTSTFEGNYDDSNKGISETGRLITIDPATCQCLFVVVQSSVGANINEIREKYLRHFKT